MFLAIGINFEHEGFAGSRSIESEDPQIVSNYLEKEFGVLFDQILLVKNDDDCPRIIEHWNIGRDYMMDWTDTN